MSFAQLLRRAVCPGCGRPGGQLVRQYSRWHRECWQDHLRVRGGLENNDRMKGAA